MNIKNTPLRCVPLLAGTLSFHAMAEPPVDTVRITGQRTAWHGLTVAGATKTDAQPLDLPQSTRTLEADLLRDAGVANLAGALELASGIARQSDLGGLWDSYAMRGFTGDPNFGSDYMVNGFSSSRGYNGRRDVAGTQSIEILKGPASALYGRGEPGGTVNIVTKKPRFAPQYGIDVALASHGTRRAAADLTGPLSDSVAYRFNLAHQAGGSFRDLVHTERTYVAPSILWHAGEDKTGELEHYQHDTFIVRWKERNFNADAYVTFALNPDGSIERMRMQPISTETDFSYDFQDLNFTPVRKTAP
ncbi:hypothetical protein GCM10025794_06880 [Massilia kyonggiensis]